MDKEQTERTEIERPKKVNASIKPTKAPAISLLIFVVILCFGSGALGSVFYNQLNTSNAKSTTMTQDGNKLITKDEEDISSVAAKVSPSVVSILSKSQTTSSRYYINEQESAGTGIIISKDGYILTNNHVVDGASTVSVIDSSGTTYDNVKVLGRDPLNDVAFLKISNVSDLTPAELGDSKSVRIGQKVIAIGNALGQYQNSVTSGIISGTGRSVVASSDGSSEGAESLADLIQTDAAINAGNSGGPLVNMAGQVIGMNTAMASDANSVGFVIPISATKGVISGVLETGKVSRAYLGVLYVTITPDVAKSYGLTVNKGAYIYSEGGNAISPNGPAAAAGLHEKDIITKVNDVEVGSMGSVSTLVGEYKPGDTIELTILRDGKTQTIKVTVAAYKS
jgi:S1-C subfamily serine protease